MKLAGIVLLYTCQFFSKKCTSTLGIKINHSKLNLNSIRFTNHQCFEKLQGNRNMFSLWYALLSWKEYKTNLLATKQTKQNPVGENNFTPEVPIILPQPVNPADSNENKSPLPPVPNSVQHSIPRSIPSPQNTIIETSFPGPMKTSPKAPLDPPPKPPRSPSPHPMRSEAFDDIEFDTEESDEEDEEEEEQNSVIDSTMIEQKRAASNVEEFLTGERNNIEKDSS